MILLKVILDNIRSHSHFEFEPALKGTTTISGENGKGKSTILDAFSWALYGTKLHGLNNKYYIKEGVDPKENLVQVQAFIIVGNREYQIVRKILNSKGLTECNVYSRPINTEEQYVHESGPGITHAEKYIRNVIGCDEKGFLSSVFIQQKQVDQIVAAGPRERGAVIEKLIGVDSISTAMTLAKDESKSLQKAVQIIQPGSLEDEHNKLKIQKELVVKYTKENELLEIQREQLKEKFNSISDVYSDEKEKQEEYSKLYIDYKVKENTLKSNQESLKSKLNIYENLGGNNFFSQDLYDEAAGKLQQISKSKYSLVSEISLLENKLKQLNNLFSKTISDEVVIVHSNLIKDREQLENETSELEIKVRIEKSNLKHNEDYIKELNNGIAFCPMCDNEIKDIDKEINTHKKKLEDSKLFIKQSLAQIKNNKQKINSLVNEIIELDNLITIKKEQESKKEEFETINVNYSNKKSELDVLEIEIKTLMKTMEDLKLSKSNYENVKILKEEIKTLNLSIGQITSELNELKKVIKNLNALPKSQFKELETDYFSVQTQFRNIDLELTRNISKIELAKQKGKEQLRIYRDCQKAKVEHENLTKQINLFNLSLKTLSDFKEIRIKTSIPKLTTIASDILRRFTDGAFNELILDENFQTFVVTNNGKKRAVAQLSGGELSAAAIALRIAIALFLNEGTQSLLILDEVIVSMDDERSQLILETITSLTQAQIIIIAHNDIVMDFSDKVIKIQ